MMKLSLMQAMFRNTDAAGFNPDILPATTAWEMDPGSLKILRASSNFIFLYHRQGEPRILRLTPAEQRTPQELQGELDFLLHLAGLGLPVNRPLPSRNGRLIETTQTRLGTFHGVALEYLEGMELELEDLSDRDFSAWGRALGDLHNAAEGFSTPLRADWRARLDAALLRLPETEIAARRAAGILEKRLSALPVTPQNFGLIHYDFELDNLLWRDGRAQVIDFDDCIHHWFAADVAYVLRDLFDDRASRVDLAHPSLQAFVAGYRSVRPLAEEELASLPLFMGLLNLLMFAELLEIVSEPPVDGEPEWTGQLRIRLEQKAQKYRGELDGIAGEGNL